MAAPPPGGPSSTSGEPKDSNSNSNSNSNSTRGIPHYEHTRTKLKDLLAKRLRLDEQLRKKEDEIRDKETRYLEGTAAGNIITGFEQYVKNAGLVKKKMTVQDSMRVFSGSSVSFGNAQETPPETESSTPMATAAPTPLSATFLKGDSGSNAATPTSTSSGNKVGGGAVKKNKKPVGGDDSDTDAGTAGVQKKARTNFGAVARK
ncbi:hypothetical protein LZ554_002219 [Drepanopeziza brunnea f. sp. 'monogermtubi']|nr:hypothetical protein LZ554_002219 [Drepanopeziza brunnea f. sp. 'monogermtubi']